jgi:hypothetical protein
MGIALAGRRQRRNKAAKNVPLQIFNNPYSP